MRGVIAAGACTAGKGMASATSTGVGEMRTSIPAPGGAPGTRRRSRRRHRRERICPTRRRSSAPAARGAQVELEFDEPAARRGSRTSSVRGRHVQRDVPPVVHRRGEAMRTLPTIWLQQCSDRIVACHDPSGSGAHDAVPCGDGPVVWSARIVRPLATRRPWAHGSGSSRSAGPRRAHGPTWRPCGRAGCRRRRTATPRHRRAVQAGASRTRR